MKDTNFIIHLLHLSYVLTHARARAPLKVMETERWREPRRCAGKSWKAESWTFGELINFCCQSNCLTQQRKDTTESNFTVKWAPAGFMEFSGPPGWEHLLARVRGDPNYYAGRLHLLISQLIYTVWLKTF